MRLRLRPTDDRYYELFSGAAANAGECARELRDLIVSFSDLPDRHARIKTLERRGDQLTIELLHRLDAAYVTPFDREDIHALAEELDDVVDDMFAVADLILLVHVTRPLPELAQMAELLVSMSDAMTAAVQGLKGRVDAKPHLERIEALERQGDGVYRMIISRLFSGEYEALEVLKWKDIVQALEDALNTIEDVSDVVESILLKNG